MAVECAPWNRNSSLSLSLSLSLTILIIELFFCHPREIGNWTWSRFETLKDRSWIPNAVVSRAVSRAVSRSRPLIGRRRDAADQSTATAGESSEKWPAAAKENQPSDSIEANKEKRKTRFQFGGPHASRRKRSGHSLVFFFYFLLLKKSEYLVPTSSFRVGRGTSVGRSFTVDCDTMAATKKERHTQKHDQLNRLARSGLACSPLRPSLALTIALSWRV